MFNLNKNKNEQEITISGNDFTEEIINNLTDEIYKNNIIHCGNENSEKNINEYLNKLKSLDISDSQLSIIKNNYIEKNEKYKNDLLNIIKKLIKKCADTFKNNTIEMNNTKLYTFKNYTGEEFTFTKNNLQIYSDKLTNENIEALINLIKYPSEKIVRIHFNNSFNKKLSECNIKKILLNIMNYGQELLSLNFNNCVSINDGLLSYIMFTVKNVKKMKILGFESCKLNDNHAKIIIEGIADHKSILAFSLRNNNLTSQGGMLISEFLNTNTTIRQLFLGGNNIRDKGLKALLDTLTTTNKNIINLDISNNNFILEDYNSLIEYLKVNPVLNALDISENKLDLKCSINLGASLCTVKNIKCINMAKMGIVSDFIPNLFKSFNLEEIILDDNILEGVGLLMFGKGLMTNKILKKISLKNTQFNSIGLTSLLDILKNAKEFKELHLENNTIDDIGADAIKQALEKFENKKVKIFVSKNMVKQELFKDIGKDSNIIMV
jgi:Ran GTPase-activating protein (RanGAP) involved in mRNA processing and transport